jgi:hypothetical protein
MGRLSPTAINISAPMSASTTPVASPRMPDQRHLG